MLLGSLREMEHGFSAFDDDLMVRDRVRDLRPYADLAVGKVAGRKVKMPDTQPLVVMLAQSHSRPDHVALSQMIVSRLSDRFRVAVGWELSHNTIWSCLGSAPFCFDLGEVQNYPPYVFDPEGQKGLVVYTSVKPDSFVPKSSFALASFLRRQGISVRFIDVAVTPEWTLDWQDSLTVQCGDLSGGRGDGALRTLFPSSFFSSEVSVGSPQGVAYRNWMLSNLAVQHGIDACAEIYLLLCGSIHPFGGVFSKGCETHIYGYAESLDARFQERGLGVLAVMPFCESKISSSVTLFLPPDLERREDVFFLGIGNERCGASVGEETHLRALSEASGGEIELPEDFEKARAAGEMRVYENASCWIQDACACLPQKGGQSGAGGGFAPVFP